MGVAAVATSPGAAETAPASAPASDGRSTPRSPAKRDRLGVAGVGVAHDAHPGVAGQHALEAARGRRGVPSATTTMPACSE